MPGGTGGNGAIPTIADVGATAVKAACGYAVTVGN